MMRLLAATLLLLAMDLPARAACPQNLSDCLGAATTFAIVAEKDILTKGILGWSPSAAMAAPGSPVGPGPARSLLPGRLLP